MARVSQHAQERLGQRVSRKAERKAKEMFAWLWRQGRMADEVDFIEFSTRPVKGRDYRVSQRYGQQYLIVRTSGGQYITIIKK